MNQYHQEPKDVIIFDSTDPSTMDGVDDWTTVDGNAPDTVNGFGFGGTGQLLHALWWDLEFGTVGNVITSVDFTYQIHLPSGPWVIPTDADGNPIRYVSAPAFDSPAYGLFGQVLQTGQSASFPEGGGILMPHPFRVRVTPHSPIGVVASDSVVKLHAILLEQYA
jgi:hypothetical protein